MIKIAIIKKLKSGKYRLYSKKKDKSGHRKNLGTFDSLSAAKKHEGQVQWFKHHADDGNADDKETSALKKMSDIAGFLEEAGLIDAADKVYMAMDAIDGSLSNDEDYLDDSITTRQPDNQMAWSGTMPYEMTGEVAGGMQGIFSIPEAEKLASLANKLDQKGLYDEADQIDEMLNIIKKLEQEEDTKVKPTKKEKEGVDVVVDSNGHVPTDVSQHSGFSGMSDAYFYSQYGNLEAPYR